MFYLVLLLVSRDSHLLICVTSAPSVGGRSFVYTIMYLCGCTCACMHTFVFEDDVVYVSLFPKNCKMLKVNSVDVLT